MSLQPVHQQQNQQLVERPRSFWQKCKDFGMSHWPLIAGAATVVGSVFSGPGNLVRAVTDIFRTSMPEAVNNVGLQACETAENIASRSLVSFDRATVEVCTTATRISNTAISSFDQNMQLLATTSRDINDRWAILGDRVVVIAETAFGAAIIYAGHALFVWSATPESQDSWNLTSLFTKTMACGAIAGGACLMATRLFSGRRRQTLAVIDQRSLQNAQVLGLLTLDRPMSSLPGNITPLLQAAYTGDVDAICALQRQGFDLESCDENGRTALHYAAQGNQPLAFQWLWYFGCDLKAADKEHRIPINYISDRQSAFYALASKLHRIKNRFEHECPIYLFYPPSNGVFKGGGPKGIAFVGVQRFLEQKRILNDVTRIAGTSAGAINATLVALGYTSNQMEQILGATNLKDFLDHPYRDEQELLSALGGLVEKGMDISLSEMISLIGSGISCLKRSRQGSPSDVFKKVYNRGGLCEGKQFLAWIEHLIKKKTGIDNCTFREFKALQAQKKFKDIYLYATRIDPMDVICLNSEDPMWEDVVIADAVRASMSIPFIFTPHILRTKAKECSIAVPAPHLGEFMDGGMIRNLPIDAFDQLQYRSTNSRSLERRWNPQTLAFNLVDPPSEVEAGPRQTTLVRAGAALANVYSSGEDILIAQNKEHRSRIIDIDNCGIDLIKGFFATEKQKRQLMDSGYAAAEAFYENQKELARQFIDHDPRKILTIGLRDSDPVQSIGIVEEPDEDRKDSFDAEYKTSLPAIQEAVSIKRETQLVTASREVISQQVGNDGALSAVIDRRRIMELRERLTRTGFQPEKLTDEEFDQRRAERHKRITESHKRIAFIRQQIFNMNDSNKGDDFYDHN